MLIDSLFENLGLEVEAFATCGVARGWRLRLPAQRLVTLHYTLRGEGALGDARGTTWNLPVRSLAVVPPGLPHLLECGTGPLAETAAKADPERDLPPLQAGPQSADELVVACGRIRASWGGGGALGLFDQLTEPLVVDFSDAPHMSAVFEALLAERQREAPGQARMMAALMQQCLVELFRRLCGRTDCRMAWLNALEDARMSGALREIIGHPERRHTVESLAKAAAMSRSAFAVRFVEVFGRTPMQYVKEFRLRAAARLLRRGDISVDAIADRAGFASRSHFSREFHQLYGRSPSDYRRAREAGAS